MCYVSGMYPQRAWFASEYSSANTPRRPSYSSLPLVRSASSLPSRISATATTNRSCAKLRLRSYVTCCTLAPVNVNGGYVAPPVFRPCCTNQHGEIHSHGGTGWASTWSEYGTSQTLSGVNDDTVGSAAVTVCTRRQFLSCLISYPQSPVLV